MDEKIEVYRAEPIKDKHGYFVYDKNPEEYLKARKRLQNRKSATKCRHKQQDYVEQLKSELEEKKEVEVQLNQNFERLGSENKKLKDKLAYFE